MMFLYWSDSYREQNSSVRYLGMTMCCGYELEHQRLREAHLGAWKEETKTDSTLLARGIPFRNNSAINLFSPAYLG